MQNLVSTWGARANRLLASLASAILLFVPAHAQDDAIPSAVQKWIDAPNPFTSREYVPTSLPTFAESRDLLPRPTISDHPEWEKLYWKAWELAFSHLMQPTPGSGFVSNFIDPAFNANTFQWDSCFMVMYAHYAEPAFHAIGTLDNFYAKQRPDGYICREIVRATGQDFVLWGELDNTINPPLFSWVEWQNYLQTGDKSRFRDVLPSLVRYYMWLRANRRRPNGLYWNTGLGAGEDDLVRNDTADTWLDMTAQQAQNAYYLARIAEQLGDKPTAAYFDGENRALTDRVRAEMWDPKTGFFYDLKKDGTPTGIKTVLGFWPLMGRIATKEQAAQLIQHLTNEKEFWRPNVVPALAADEAGYSADGQYWNGAVWAPTNYMVVNGLQAYGYDDLARTLTERYLVNMSAVLDATGTIWENYAPESAAGHGVKDMVGWSGDGPIAMMIENVLGIRASAADNRIYWRPRLPGENGLQNLLVGRTRVTLMAEPVANGFRELRMECDKPIVVFIDTGSGRNQRIQLGTGEKVLKVKVAA